MQRWRRERLPLGIQQEKKKEGEKQNGVDDSQKKNLCWMR